MSSGVRSIRVVVLGDQGVGKTSLLVAVSTESFPERPPPVLPPTRLPQDFFQDRVSLTLIDTSSRKEDIGAVEEECRKADSIVLCYACDQLSTLYSLRRFWVPMLRRLQVKAPLVLVGCRMDLRTGVEEDAGPDAAVGPLMQEFREIETCLECSALKHIQVAEVFFYAQKAVLHPTAPLYDNHSQLLRPAAIRALKRVFVLCDRDRDGVLSDAELNSFQVHCFSAPLQPVELAGVKMVVAEKMPQGVVDKGLTLQGFLFLHALFVERGRLETTWCVLRTFGYRDDLHLNPELLPLAALTTALDQSVEVSDKGWHFLRDLFTRLDTDGDEELTSDEVEELFSTAPKHLWEDAVYKGSVEAPSNGGVTLKGFLAQWALMVHLDPEEALAAMVYCGLPLEEASQMLRLTRRRRLDKKKGRNARETIVCLMAGPKQGGKKAMLNCFLQRPFEASGGEQNGGGAEEEEGGRYAANIVGSLPTGAESGAVLILHSVSEEELVDLLQDPPSLSRFDCCAFVYDSSSLSSWEKCGELVEAMAGAGCQLPTLMVAAKDDLPPHPQLFQATAKLCSDMGLPPPIPCSARLGDAGELWTRVVAAASKPNLGFPETSAARSSKAMRLLMQRTLVASGVLAAVTVSVAVGYRLYSQHKSNSS